MQKIAQSTILDDLNAWAEVRHKRAVLLNLNDKKIAAANSAGMDATALQDYRVLLLDIPQTYAKPSDIVWPEAPTL